MSQSEDYLDGLLNSINKAKTDAEQVQERVQTTNQKILNTRKAVAPDEDFFTATGIDSRAMESMQPKSSHPYLRKVLSEDDFLRQFEEELGMDDVDTFISDFEQEIDDEERIFQETGKAPESEDIVGALLDNIDSVVSDATKKLDEEDSMDSDTAQEEDSAESESEAEAESDDSMVGGFDLDALMNEDDSESADEAGPESGGSDLTGDEPIKLPDDEEIDLSAFITEDDGESDDDSDEEDLSLESESSEDDDDLGFSLDDATSDVDEEPLDESMKEFLPDEMDALDEALYGEGEEPNLSGEDDMDLENLLDGEDEDLLDIQSLLTGDEEGAGEGAEIDESAESGGDEPADDGGKKGKKEKKKKEKKKKGEKGEKKPNPFLQKLLLIIFGAPDEDEIAEMEAEAAKAAATVEITYDEEGNPIIPEGGAAPVDPKEQKKKEKEEKKKAKEAAKKEKEAAKKEGKKEKPAKAPKPKKEKKPKEPDNSPKIPISIIATFLVLSISIISVVMVGMTFTGLKRHMAQAKDDFAAGNYIAAYEKLNGFDLGDEEVLLMRNQARTLADLQQCQDEFDTFIMYEKYNYALDSLIKGIGRYDKYKDDAVEYGISEQYDAYGEKLSQELMDNFGLTTEQALEIYKQPNRHYYTIELRKVLRGLGLPDL